MRRSTPQIFFLLVFLIYLRGNLGSNSGVGQSKIRCKEAERQALLRIKEELYVRGDSLLLSWGKEEGKRECCDWTGIRCDNKSGHVISLNLSRSTFNTVEYRLEGNISSSLVDLKYLNRLDFSEINFRGNSIPSFIGSLNKLRCLDLSDTSLDGEIPPQLGNLSSLQFLDLGIFGFNIKSLDWLSHLSSLCLFYLNHTNMSLAHDWVYVVNNLPLLTNLQVHNCKLPNIVTPSMSFFNSSKVLRFLDISSNSLSLLKNCVLTAVFNCREKHSHGGSKPPLIRTP